jgi:hypothetical protein
MWHQYVGLVGDVLTFCGGLILSLDALSREQEFKRIQTLAETIKDPMLARVKFTKEGIQLKTEKDAELVYIRRSTKRAKWGTLVVTAGFVLLVFVRLAEILRPAEPGG